MPDNEWVRLTEEGRDWPVAADYRRAGQTLTLHEIQTRWWDDPPETPNGRSVLLTTAELAAIPAVAALVEAARRLSAEAHPEPGDTMEPPGPDFVIDPATLAELDAASAAFAADDDPDRPLEDDEFQSWNDEPGYCG